MTNQERDSRAPAPNRSVESTDRPKQSLGEAAFDSAAVILPITSIIVTNLAALAIAYYEQLDVLTLMVVYWCQSVIIGVAAASRIRYIEELEFLARKGNRKRKITFATTQFFALHYAAFHAFYLMFLVVFMLTGADVVEIGLPTVLCIAVFALEQYGWHRRARKQDMIRAPHTDRVVAAPYFRILPMHVTIVLGAIFGGTLGLGLFGVLKTVAEVLAYKYVNSNQQA